MKKILKLLVALVLAIAIIGFVTFLIDCSRVKSGKKPIFAREIAAINDGGTIEYIGIGYKIIDFNRLNGYDETKIGFLNIKYEDYAEEYNKLDKNVVNENNNMDDLNNNDIISGDIEVQENISGDIAESGDSTNVTEISGDSSETVEESGDEGVVEEGYYFRATIIGVNNNNLVVQALEDEEITKSSDMFSFSLKDTDGSMYLIGQKVKIKYTGEIRESYPAQIDVLDIEIIE